MSRLWLSDARPLEGWRAAPGSPGTVAKTIPTIGEMAMYAFTLALLGWLAWAVTHGWSPLWVGMLALGTLVVLAVEAEVAEFGLPWRFSHWVLTAPGSTLVLYARLPLWPWPQRTAYDLSTVCLAHTDSSGRLVLRQDTDRVVAWAEAVKVRGNPDLVGGLLEALRARGVTVSASPPRDPAALVQARTRGQRLRDAELRELEQAGEAGERPVQHRRAWARARWLALPDPGGQ